MAQRQQSSLDSLQSPVVSAAAVLLREYHGSADLLALAATQPQRYPALLQSVAHGPSEARWDILFALPQDHLRCAADGRVRDAAGRDHGASFFDALDGVFCTETQSPGRAAQPGDELPFCGGWALFLGYELAAQVEPILRLPQPAERRIPDGLALRCPAAILIDHRDQRCVLVAETSHAEALDLLARDLDVCTRHAPGGVVAVQAIEEDATAQFTSAVRRVHDYLLAGDVFQVNLSREWRAELSEPVAPAIVYEALCRANPAPFAGLLQFEDWAVLSSSPERLVEVRGDLVQTRPIAGTRPRFAGDDDAQRMRELIGHPKERAEHVMLIDLERNDLGRICTPGSVVVDELMSVESYTHVHHIVSNVRGRLRAGVTPGQVIRAVFPGGTITGCPKVRCMQIIAELEGVGRGAYTGALGYLDRNGNMDLNILIRSISQVGTRLRLRAGAGIVVDSDPDHELDETRAKARGVLRALGLPP